MRAYLWVSFGLVAVLLLAMIPQGRQNDWVDLIALWDPAGPPGDHTSASALFRVRPPQGRSYQILLDCTQTSYDLEWVASFYRDGEPIHSGLGFRSPEALGRVWVAGDWYFQPRILMRATGRGLDIVTASDQSGFFDNAKQVGLWEWECTDRLSEPRLLDARTPACWFCHRQGYAPWLAGHAYYADARFLQGLGISELWERPFHHW